MKNVSISISEDEARKLLQALSLAQDEMAEDGVDREFIAHLDRKLSTLLEAYSLQNDLDILIKKLSEGEPYDQN